VAVEHPAEAVGEPPKLLALVPLKDAALSVSAVWGKAFQSRGKSYGHVIDPRTGRPASNSVLAAVVLPSATETDAFSTALLTLGAKGHEHIGTLRPAIRTLVLSAAKKRAGWQVRARGIEINKAR
jgi:thiamine biosynthesis lipoprotein